MNICLVGGIFDRPEVVRSRQRVTPETVLLDGFRRSGVRVHAVGHAGFRPSDDYDVVHVHHFGRAALAMAASGSRAHTVFTGHNGMIATGRERSRLRRYTFQYVVDRADAIVALSRSEARYFAGVTRPDKVHVIPNGIPADVFRTARDLAKRADGTRYDLLYVGQLIECKGVGVLLDAMPRLRRTRDVRLRLVYHNAEQEPALRQRAAALGVAPHVEFVGIRAARELVEEYHRAEALVLPSFAECLPSVVTEALLCGTPVVATAVGGIPEQIGPYGFTVPPGDAGALAAAIERVLAERSRWQARAKEMRAYAEDTFDPDTMVARHLALYRALIERNPAPARRRAAWLDPAMRLAVDVYWARRRALA